MIKKVLFLLMCAISVQGVQGANAPGPADLEHVVVSVGSTQPIYEHNEEGVRLVGRVPVGRVRRAPVFQFSEASSPGFDERMTPKLLAFMDRHACLSRLRPIVARRGASALLIAVAALLMPPGFTILSTLIMSGFSPRNFFKQKEFWLQAFACYFFLILAHAVYFLCRSARGANPQELERQQCLDNLRSAITDDPLAQRSYLRPFIDHIDRFGRCRIKDHSLGITGYEVVLTRGDYMKWKEGLSASLQEAFRLLEDDLGLFKAFRDRVLAMANSDEMPSYFAELLDSVSLDVEGVRVLFDRFIDELSVDDALSFGDSLSEIRDEAIKILNELQRGVAGAGAGAGAGV